MPNPTPEELEFLSDLRSAVQKGPKMSANLLLLTMIVFFVGAMVWASYAEIDQVTRGSGKVIPSGQVQVVQNLEGGIVSEILVKEGQTVKRNQVLLRIDDTRLASEYRENQTESLALKAQIARLQAEINPTELRFPEELTQKVPEVIADETALYLAHQQQLQSTIAILTQQAEQQQQELTELKARIKPLHQSLNYAKQEVEMTIPMVEKGVTSKVELLRLQRQISELSLNLQSARLQIPKAKSALTEAHRRIKEEQQKARSLALAELNKARNRLNTLTELVPALKDKVLRTEVRSPVEGIIKTISVNTIGGVIQSGMSLVEIVPLEKNLLVEAKINPADIAFIHPQQPAQVKITAYDFAIYGALAAKLEHISADTINDEQGNSFYLIRVRTEHNHLYDKAHKPLPIIPGMTAEVDVITGKKTVMAYLLKPILRAWGQALREP